MRVTYIFTALVIVNILTLVYFTFWHTPKPSQSVADAQSSLIHPIDFKNSSADAPPLIGKK